MILKYQKLKFFLELEERIVLPPYKGSALRGGFGSTLRRIACVMKKETCFNCLLKGQCAYAYIFETAPYEGTRLMKMEKYETVPRPFVIEPPKESKSSYEPGEKLVFDLLLIGKGINYLPYFILVFDELGRTGLGRGKGKFKLVEIWHKNSKIYSAETRILSKVESDSVEVPESVSLDESNWVEEEMTIAFKTPVRIKYNRELVSKLEFFILITNILRRLCLLNYFHGELKEPDWNHRQIIELARNVRIKNNSLLWYDWERYSGRQKTRLKFGGLKGEITYGGKIEGFRPWLRAGEIFHVGKATAFGLGEYTILTENGDNEIKRNIEEIDRVET